MEHDEERQHELIEDLLAGRAPASLGDLTAEEVELAQTAALLMAARPGALQPDPEFVRALGERLFGATGEEGGTDAPPSAPPADKQPDRTRDRRPLSRRRLLGALAGSTAAGLALGAVAGRAAAESEATARLHAAESRLAAAEHSTAAAETRPYHVPLIGSLGQWVTVAEDDEVPPGGTKRFEQGALIGYLLRDQAGGYRAVSAACTHMGCLLTWQHASRRLLCPCHGSAYDELGKVVSGVARHPLPAIEVRVLPTGEVQVWTIGAQATSSGVPRYQVP